MNQSQINHETPVDKLHKDVETASRQLHQVQKEAEILDEEIAAAEKRLKKARIRCKDRSPELIKDIRNVERCLKLEAKGCNVKQSESSQLRKQIEVHRLEKNHYKKTVDGLSSEINKIKAHVRNQRSRYMRHERSEERYRDRAVVLQTVGAWTSKGSAST